MNAAPGLWSPGLAHFECVLCGESCLAGVCDPVERVLGDGERGVCDDCWLGLPPHVIEWAEEREERGLGHG